MLNGRGGFFEVDKNLKFRFVKGATNIVSVLNAGSVLLKLAWSPGWGWRRLVFEGIDFRFENTQGVITDTGLRDHVQQFFRSDAQAFRGAKC